jgi:prepilin-type N-terminal cleavage/methylation domain-containing protein
VRLDKAEEGFTLTEMLVVLLILGVVIGGLTALLVSGIKSESDQTARAQGQIDARSALDQLRREVHCGSAVDPNGSWPTNAITITLGSYCPTNRSGATAYVTWCTTGTGPYTLQRILNGATAPSPNDYAHACTGAGRIWASDIVNSGAITGGKIFSSPVTPSLPAMGDPDLSYGSGNGSTVAGVSYAYIVDPVVSGVEQPGTENLITPQQSGKTILVDWGGACSVYPQKASISQFKIYGRTTGAEQWLKTVTSAGCATTTWTDDITGTPSGAPAGATRAQLSVTIPVRADNSTIRLISLPDALTLRNTPR